MDMSGSFPPVIGCKGHGVLAHPGDGERLIAPHETRQLNILADFGLDGQSRIEERWRLWGKHVRVDAFLITIVFNYLETCYEKKKKSFIDGYVFLHPRIFYDASS